MTLIFRCIFITVLLRQGIRHWRLWNQLFCRINSYPEPFLLKKIIED